MEEGAAGGFDPATLQDQVHHLTQLVALLQQQQQQTQATAAAAANAAAATAAAFPSPKCPISPPEKFSGKVEEFPAFLAQCKLFIELRDRDFTSDKAKVSFIISLLKGQAAKWATPLLVAPSPLLTDYQGFLQHLQTAFDNPVRASTANRRIRALKQGKGSVALYSTEFQLLAQDLDWNEAALRDQFMEGLSDEVQDELARVECPPTLQGVITLCLRIDGRLDSRRHTRNQRMPPSPRQPAQVGPPPAPSGRPDNSEPMQLGAARPRLTPEEKARRRGLNLCLYCGGVGHFSATCPAKPRPLPPPKEQPQA